MALLYCLSVCLCLYATYEIVNVSYMCLDDDKQIIVFIMDSNTINPYPYHTGSSLIWIHIGNNLNYLRTYADERSRPINILFAKADVLVSSFCMLFCRLLIFFKINFFEKFFQEYYPMSVKQFESRSSWTFCWA